MAVKSIFLSVAHSLKTRPVFWFLLWAFWLASGYLVFGKSSYVDIFDNGDSILPAMVGLKHVFAFPPFSWWNAQWLAGADLVPQGMTSEIDSLPFAILPGWLAYGATMYLQRFVAGYFTYRLLRESLELDILPATLGAMTYSVFKGGYDWGFSLYDHFTLPALPFILWALSRTSQARRPIMYWMAGGIGLLFSLVSIYTYAVFLIPLILFWLLFLTPGGKSRVFIVFSVFLGVWLLGELPALWASWLNVGESNRVYGPQYNWEYGAGYLLQKAEIVQRLIASDKVATGLLFLGIISVGAKDRRLVKVSIALLVSLCLVMFLPLVRTLVLGTGLQFLASFTLERVSILVPFLLMLCGAVGAQAVKNSRTLIAAAALGFTTLMFTVRPLLKSIVGATGVNSILTELTIERLLRHLRLLAIALGAVGVYSAVRAKQFRLWEHCSRFSAIPLSTLIVAGAIFFVGWDSLQINRTILSRREDGRKFSRLYDDPGVRSLVKDTEALDPFRVVTITDSFRFGEIHPAYAWAYGLESADGYIAMYPRRYKDFWAMILAPINAIEPNQFNNFIMTTRSYLYPPVEGFSPDKAIDFSAYYDLELLSLANVRYVLSPLPVDDDRLSLYSSQRDGEGVYIYENKSVLPRFFLAGRSMVYSGQGPLLEAMGTANTAQLQSEAFLSQSDVENLTLNKLDGQGGAVRIVSYSTDQIVLDVQSLGTNWLIAGNSYSPYWTALVDGNKESVFPVYHTFQGVYLEGGQHEVVLRYQPPYAIKFK